ncbi:MAG: pantetheine-phosphate adenylyltransferase [Solitalea-like symbiont of Tyrophagus putrescentiae]
MEKIALLPGSFDPITTAHQDIIIRASKLFDKLIVGIGINRNKNILIPKEKREEMVKAVFVNNTNIEVVVYNELTIDFCKRMNINYLVRGIRSVSDFEYESPIAQINYIMEQSIETIFILSRVEFLPVSSTIVREIIKYKGNADKFIPKEALNILKTLDLN